MKEFGIVSSRRSLEGLLDVWDPSHIFYKTKYEPIFLFMKNLSFEIDFKL